MKYLAVLFLLTASAFSKDVIAVKVIATHQVTHEARDSRAIIDKGILGAGTPGRTVEVFNLDTIINGEHVLLTCEDDKGCESPATDAEYQGEMRGKKFVHLAFSLPVSHKEVKRWYKISGSW